MDVLPLCVISNPKDNADKICLQNQFMKAEQWLFLDKYESATIRIVFPPYNFVD